MPMSDFFFCWLMFPTCDHWVCFLLYNDYLLQMFIVLFFSGLVLYLQSVSHILLLSDYLIYVYVFYYFLLVR